MGKKAGKQFKPNIFRMAIFLAISGALIWGLSSQVEVRPQQKDLEENREMVKGEEFLEESIKDEKPLDLELKNNQQKLIERINKESRRLLPEVVKKEIERINQRFYQQGDKVVRNTEEIIRETKLAKEIERIILQTMEEIEGFPEKQKEDVKNELIRQVCDELMKEIENEDKN